MENLQGSVYEKRMIRAPVASLALLSYFADPSRLNWQEQVVTLYGPDPGAFRDTPRLDVAGNKRMSELCMFEMPTGKFQSFHSRSLEASPLYFWIAVSNFL